MGEHHPFLTLQIGVFNAIYESRAVVKTLIGRNILNERFNHRRAVDTILADEAPCVLGVVAEAHCFGGDGDGGVFTKAAHLHHPTPWLPVVAIAFSLIIMIRTPIRRTWPIGIVRTHSAQNRWQHFIVNHRTRASSIRPSLPVDKLIKPLVFIITAPKRHARMVAQHLDCHLSLTLDLGDEILIVVWYS